MIRIMKLGIKGGAKFLVLSVIAAIIVTQFGTAQTEMTCDGLCPEPLPIPTATPDARITAIQQLPLQGRAPSNTTVYTAGITDCVDKPDACTTYAFAWYGIVHEQLNPNFTEPGRETAAVTEIDETVVIPDGFAAIWPSDEWQVGMETDLYTFDDVIGQYGVDPTCPTNWTVGGGYVVKGCVTFPGNGLGPWGGISGRFKPAVTGLVGTTVPPCAEFNIPGCLYDFNPSWHHRLM